VLFLSIGVLTRAPTESQQEILTRVQHPHDPDRVGVHLVKHSISTDENLPNRGSSRSGTTRPRSENVDSDRVVWKT
jgi:hypothetical protein